MIDPPAPDRAVGPPTDNGAALPTAADLAAELARAQERLSFYESFDTLIRDNVVRSGELLREVAAQREQTEQKLLAMRAEVDKRLAEQRSTLKEIAAGLSTLQANLGALAESVSGSLSALPDAGEVSSSQLSTTQASGETLDLAQSGSPAAAKMEIAPSPPAIAVPAKVTGDGLRAAQVGGIEAPAPAPAASEQVGETTAPNGSSGVADAVADQGERASSPEEPGSHRRKIDLIVHGVPRAATALSLQRHLQELEGVETVEVREYVSGVLRFQVLAAALSPNDFRAWPNGAGLEVVTARDNVLELKLPTAEGF